ncbi:EF-P 5-aminopentanol modification-associated protein YfmF [Natranaerobius thermophilus]|nr:pitrilysin family protein [Natranaerobius thermophilus]
MSQTELDTGIRLHYIPKTNLKTTLIKVFFHWPLGDYNGHMAVIPKVLERGPSPYPSITEFYRQLEEMYGAELVTGVHKKGERQMIEFRLETVSQDFLLEQGKQYVNLDKVIKLMSQVIFEPVTKGAGFKKELVEQEKKNQIDRIKKLKDDKTNYAVERLIAHMCENEPFSKSKFGTEEEVKSITPYSLYEQYRKLLSSAPIDIFVVGHFSQEELNSAIQKHFNFPDRENIPNFTTEIIKDVDETKEVKENEKINQSKLCLGFRTQISFKDELIFPLMLFNGVLGGFSHSRLFRVVREQHSLCYYVLSRLEKSKGVMVVNAGIQKEDYEKTVELITKELEKLRQDDIQDKELDMTKQSLLSAMRQIEDNPDAICETILEGIINDRVMTPEEIKEKIANVDRDRILTAAQKVALDTVYIMADAKQEKVGVT